MQTLPPRNSTNVRLESPLDPWPPRVPQPGCAPVVALVAWTAFVAWAGADGVFARLEAPAFAALVAFVLAFVVAACAVDREVRASLAAMRGPLARALGLDAVVAGWLLLASHGDDAWAAFPGAVVLLVALPLAAALHLAAARVPRLRRAAGASPAAKRASP